MTIDELKAEYPTLFDECYDFSIGQGWMILVESLVKMIGYDISQTYESLELGKSQVGTNNEKYWVGRIPKLEARLAEWKENPPKILQIKEKFGGLRFYMYGSSDKWLGAIELAETLSYKICEDCGNKAEVRTEGWIRSMCLRCVEAHNNKEDKDKWHRPYTYNLISK